MLMLSRVPKRRLLKLSTSLVGCCLVIYTAVFVLGLFELTGRRLSTELLSPAVDEVDGRWVVVLTYQRCGSSFFGQLFNSNPDAFYMFEPIDAVYSALYGTALGWNIPSDITTYWNGTERVVPDDEIAEVSRFLDSLFTCDVDALPTELLLHSYWTLHRQQFNTSRNYAACLRKSISWSKMKACHRMNPHYCGVRFGERSENRQPVCRQQLRPGPGPVAIVDNITVGNTVVPRRVLEKYDAYRTCMADLRKRVTSACSQYLLDVCRRSKLRAVKTVRATMSSMDALLRTHPQIRVLHLIRDPRAVVFSRLKGRDESIIGRHALGAGNDTELAALREAAVYCRAVVQDVRVRRRLEAAYPGRVMTVTYEDVVRDMRRSAVAVYDFVGVALPNATALWADGAQSPVDALFNATFTATKWMREFLTAQNYAIVNDVCREFFELVKNPWPS